MWTRVNFGMVAVVYLDFDRSPQHYSYGIIPIARWAALLIVGGPYGWSMLKSAICSSFNTKSVGSCDCARVSKRRYLFQQETSGCTGAYSHVAPFESFDLAFSLLLSQEFDGFVTCVL